MSPAHYTVDTKTLSLLGSFRHSRFCCARASFLNYVVHYQRRCEAMKIAPIISTIYDAHQCAPISAPTNAPTIREHSAPRAWALNWLNVYVGFFVFILLVRFFVVFRRRCFTPFVLVWQLALAGCLSAKRHCTVLPRNVHTLDVVDAEVMCWVCVCVCVPGARVCFGIQTNCERRRVRMRAHRMRGERVCVVAARECVSNHQPAIQPAPHLCTRMHACRRLYCVHCLYVWCRISNFAQFRAAHVCIRIYAYLYGNTPKRTEYPHQVLHTHTQTHKLFTYARESRGFFAVKWVISSLELRDKYALRKQQQQQVCKCKIVYLYRLLQGAWVCVTSQTKQTQSMHHIKLDQRILFTSPCTAQRNWCAGHGRTSTIQPGHKIYVHV